MKAYFNILLLITITSLLLPACGGDTPQPLAVPGELTLVYVYTDG